MSDFQGKTENYTRKVEIVEEFLNIDDSLVELEQNKELIRMEMNIVEFPIFSRSKNLKVDQIKKYYFSSDKQSYLEVVPAVKTTIPGELEERVFISLLKIFRNSGYQQSFYCKMSDIFDNMKVDNFNTRNSLYAKIRQSISKLATTTFKFKNLFYSSEINNISQDLIVTNILTYRVVTFKDSTSNEKNLFADKRIKEVYKITLAQHFFENIIKKGYLTFDADELLNIKDSVTRSIYTMITKWRNNKLYLIKPAFYIARRVPLSWEGSSIRKTVLRIEKSLNDLKADNYISGFNLIKKGKWEKVEFEIFFDEVHNKIKRENFYDEKSVFDKMIMHIEDRQNEVDGIDPNFYKEPEYLEILNVFPEVAKKLKTLPTLINEALKKYEVNYVKFTAEYTAYNCKTSFIKYFKEALEKNWAEEYIAKKELKLEKQLKQKDKVIEEAILIEEPKDTKPTSTWEEYLNLDSDSQNEICAAAYEDFLMQSESNDNKTMRGIFEKSKKALILKIMDKYDVDKYPVKTKIIETHVEEIKLEEKKNISGKKEEILSPTVSDTFASFSHFLLAVNDFVAENGISIDLPKVISIFKLLGEYEDFNIKFTYDEATKFGKIMKK